MAHEVVVVDAFTREPFAGNPCAVVLDANGLNDTLMRHIAREMNLPETVFVFPSHQAQFRLRFFTLINELPMAGHPTIAATHALREAGRIAADATQTSYEVRAGVLSVAIDPHRQRYTMTQFKPEFLRKYDRDAIASALGIEPAAISSAPMPQTVSTGTPMLVVPLRSAATLDSLKPDHHALYDLTDRDYFGVHVFAPNEGGTHAFIARHFGPVGDILEDPVTGSASGCLAAFAWHYDMIGDSTFTISQGSHVGRPGTVYASVLGDAEAPTAVTIGGDAITIWRGAFTDTAF